MDNASVNPLPPSLRALLPLARNLWWTWNDDATAMFRDIDYRLWEECDHNPVRLLRTVAAERLAQLAVNPVYVGLVERNARSFEEYMRAPGPGEAGSAAAPETRAGAWAVRHLPAARADRPIAYFCAEYGLHESLHLYSGGLGMLAGDHLKSSSDLGLPLVGIGLLYRQGYFRQRINADGWQEEFYDDANFDELPLEPARRADGERIVVELSMRGRPVRIQAWRLDVGRVPLFLLDTDREDNEPIDRWITAHLYGGDTGTRILQEMVLGIGGIRLLRALGIRPAVHHLNEGHSAFLTLELVRERVVAGRPFAQACRDTAAECVFTTHTPVAAGNDVFEIGALQDSFGPYLAGLGTDVPTVLGLGRRHPTDALEPFGMTPLAIRLSRSTNGVSARHGEVCQRMWQPLAGEAGTRIGSVTNGVHLPSWVAPMMRRLYDRHLGPHWAMAVDDPATWERLDAISDEELWATHCALRHRLVTAARHRAETQWRAMPGLDHLAGIAPRLLEPDALTIGFARRLAGYKRWYLLVHDLERVFALLGSTEQPVQFVLAGKAHPRDNEAKRILQQLMEFKLRPELHGRVVFLEDYDQYVARKLVQGVDVWLNLPLPPLEASGTSGMKIVANGGLNCSILDGWWIEGSNGRNGWDIGTPYRFEDEVAPTHESRDAEDARSLLDTIENRIRPLFYERDERGLPRGWIARMRESIRTLAPAFSATRMVKDYTRLYYPDGR